MQKSPNASTDSPLVSRLLEEIRKQFASDLVEINYFGKGTTRSVWITHDSWRRLASFLKKETQTLSQDHPFESLFVFKLDEEWVLTYSIKDLIFVRCSMNGQTIESLSDLWPLAAVFEQEMNQKHELNFVRIQ